MVTMYHELNSPSVVRITAPSKLERILEILNCPYPPPECTQKGSKWKNGIKSCTKKRLCYFVEEFPKEEPLEHPLLLSDSDLGCVTRTRISKYQRILSCCFSSHTGRYDLHLLFWHDFSCFLYYEMRISCVFHA